MIEHIRHLHSRPNSCWYPPPPRSHTCWDPPGQHTSPEFPKYDQPLPPDWSATPPQLSPSSLCPPRPQCLATCPLEFNGQEFAFATIGGDGRSEFMDYPVEYWDFDEFWDAADSRRLSLPYLHHDPSSSSIPAAADFPPPPLQRSSPTNHHRMAVSCLEQPPSRHRSPMAPLPAAAAPPHADNYRRPSRLHLPSSMEKEWERELQEGESEGEERLCQREEKLIEHNGILKQKESDFALEQTRTELLDLNLKNREEDVDIDVEFKEVKETNKALHLEERNLTSLRREGLVYALTNASESATTRIQHGLSMVSFYGNGEWIRRSTILLCSKQLSCSFDPGGAPRKVVLIAKSLLSTIIIASWFPP